jgi:hypothetical protein
MWCTLWHLPKVGYVTKIFTYPLYIICFLAFVSHNEAFLFIFAFCCVVIFQVHATRKGRQLQKSSACKKVYLFLFIIQVSFWKLSKN